MKKPTLRLRQVFEGPTHFKVVKPLGNPIKIAKKGLSPKLMGRLRKFARDGEVPEATEQDEQNAQDLMDELVQPATRGQAVDPVAASQALDVGEVMPPVGVPVEVVRSGDVAQTPIEALPEPERIKAISQMGPTLPRITEPEPLAPMKPSPAIEEEAVKTEIESALVDKSLAQIRTLIEKEMEKDDPDYKKLGSLAETYERLNKPIETPAAPVAVATAPKAPAVAPAAVVAPAAATVAAPTAPVAPEPAVAVAPTAAPAAPVAPISQVAPPPAVKPTELTPEQLFNKRLVDVGLDRAAYDKMTPLQKMAAQGLVRQAAALESQTAADEEMVKGEIKAQQDIIDEEKRRLDTLETRANESRDLQKKILEEMDHLKNPQSYFASMSTLGQIGSALSLAAGAFASGMTGMPNYAMQIFNNAVEKDLELQKMKRNSLFARLRDAGHSVESAEEVVRASARLVASAQAGKLAAMTKLPKVKASLALEQAKLTNDAIMKMAQVAEIEARPEERKAEREERALRRKEIDARASAALEERRLAREQREELARQKRRDLEEERRVNVGGESFELFQKQGGAGIRKELAGRLTALRAAIELEEKFKEAGMQVFNPASEHYRGEVIAAVPLLIEQYPGGKGFARAISLNAGKFLKDAMQDPTSWKAAAKSLFFDRDPAVGVKALAKDFEIGYRDAIRNYLRNSESQEVTDAVERELSRIRKAVKAGSGSPDGLEFSTLSAPAAAPATPVGVPPGGMPMGMR
jgi:hypothetical protein